MGFDTIEINLVVLVILLIIPLSAGKTNFTPSLPSKAVFQRLSSIRGSLPLKVLFH